MGKPLTAVREGWGFEFPFWLPPASHDTPSRDSSALFLWLGVG